MLTESMAVPLGMAGEEVGATAGSVGRVRGGWAVAGSVAEAVAVMMARAASQETAQRGAAAPEVKVNRAAIVVEAAKGRAARRWSW